MPYELTMIVRENGKERTIVHTKSTERECDEAQLAELPGLENRQAEFVGASVARVRERRI